MDCKGQCDGEGKCDQSSEVRGETRSTAAFVKAVMRNHLRAIWNPEPQEQRGEGCNCKQLRVAIIGVWCEERNLSLVPAVISIWTSLHLHLSWLIRGGNSLLSHGCGGRYVCICTMSIAELWRAMRFNRNLPYCLRSNKRIIVDHILQQYLPPLLIPATARVVRGDNNNDLLHHLSGHVG